MKTISNVRRALLLFSLMAASFGTCVTSVRSGTVLDYLDLNPNNFVKAIAVQPDGKILVGGDFTSIAGQSRYYIARLDPVTGIPDSNVYLTSNGTIRCIVIQPDGKIIVAGGFSSIGGQARRYIARVDPQTGQADSFNPNPDLSVNTVAIDQYGKIVVGGYFTQIGGQSRNRIARLDPVTGLADSFNPNASGADASGAVETIAVQPDGKIVAGGYFNQIGGQPRNYIARLDPKTGLADELNPGANGSVEVLTVQRDGNILVGGNFTVFGGQTRRGLARLDAVTGLPDPFNPSTSGSNAIYSIVLQPDDKILVGGYFGAMSGVPRNCVARINPDGRCDDFNPNVNDTVWAIAVQLDGKVLVGGGFWTVSGQPRNNIARFQGEVSFATPTPIPTPVPLAIVNGKIAFSEGGPIGPFQISVVNPDGTGYTRLTNNQVYLGCDSPSWSPDGTKIVFSGWGLTPFHSFPYLTQHRDIYVMNADGSNQVRLTNSNDPFPINNYLSPAWSPDGKKIAFAKIPNNSSGSGADVQFQIFVMDASGANQTRLTDFADSSGYLPAWSPNGRQITFTRAFSSQEEGQIWVMNFDGRNPRQLTNLASKNYGSSWSPDGTMIVYSRKQSSPGDTKVFVMTADGKNPTVLTPFGGVNPVWSPDGTKIAFNGGGLALMDPDGSNYLPLQVSVSMSAMSWQRLPAGH